MTMRRSHMRVFALTFGVAICASNSLRLHRKKYIRRSPQNTSAEQAQADNVSVAAVEPHNGTDLAHAEQAQADNVSVAEVEQHNGTDRAHAQGDNVSESKGDHLLQTQPSSKIVKDVGHEMEEVTAENEENETKEVEEEEVTGKDEGEKVEEEEVTDKDWDEVSDDEEEEELGDPSADIGIFSNCVEHPTLQYWGDDISLSNVSGVQTTMQQLGMNPSGMFQHFPDVELLHAEQRVKLMQTLDLSCSEREVDCKLTWIWEQLREKIGTAAVQQLSSFHAEHFDTIMLRRTGAQGNCINFHKDVSSTLTATVPLNSPEEYVGGRMTFITNDNRLIHLARPAGSATVHDDLIVHGVTRLVKGVRYGLYLLQKSASSKKMTEC